jgi:signal transduction histidine kinase
VRLFFVRLRPRRLWPQRLWPQRVRARLTLTYALLFLAGGSALLGLTYGLVAATLPTSAAPGVQVLSRADYARLCKPGGIPVPASSPSAKSDLPPVASPSPAATKSAGPNSKLSYLCRQAYRAGTSAGLISQRDRALNSLLLYSLIGLGLATIASAGVGWIVSGRVIRPVTTITQTARRASEQHLGERIGLAGPSDELKELADTFDDMLARLDQAFATQRRFVADASHELRTPLTVMRTALDVALAKPVRTVAQLEATAIRVRATIDRAESMIDALLTLAVSDRGQLAVSEPFDLATAAEDAVDSVASEIGQLGLRLTSDLKPAGTAGDPQLLDRMIANLVTNAVRHNHPGGEITLTSGTRDGRAFFHIVNTGPVVPEAAVASLFDPFTRLGGRVDGGAGLGLAIAKSVATAHGSTVRVTSRAGGGLDVQVTMSR